MAVAETAWTTSETGAWSSYDGVETAARGIRDATDSIANGVFQGVLTAATAIWTTTESAARSTEQSAVTLATATWTGSESVARSTEQSAVDTATQAETTTTQGLQSQADQAWQTYLSSLAPGDPPAVTQQPLLDTALACGPGLSAAVMASMCSGPPVERINEPQLRDSSLLGQRLAALAQGYAGSNQWKNDREIRDQDGRFTIGSDRCNKFVADVAREAGLAVPHINGRLAALVVPTALPSARDWADPNRRIGNWQIVQGPPKPGDILSIGGHVGIYVGNGLTASASTKFDYQIVVNDWGMRKGQNPVIRSFIPPQTTRVRPIYPITPF